MKYGNRKLAKKKIMGSPVTLVVLFLVFVFLLKASLTMAGKWKESGHKLTKTQTELAALAMKEDELSLRIEYMKSDEGVESEARRKYRAVKEGESVAVIVEEDAADTATNTTDSEENKVGFFRKVLRLFGL